MEVALRRRLEGVADVSISQSQQTAVVRFRPRTYRFSAAAFRDAVAEADVTVVTVQLEVCGMLDEENVMRSSTNFGTTFVRIRGDAPTVGPACLTGMLDEHANPHELELTTRADAPE